MCSSPWPLVSVRRELSSTDQISLPLHFMSCHKKPNAHPQSDIRIFTKQVRQPGRSGPHEHIVQGDATRRDFARSDTTTLIAIIGPTSHLGQTEKSGPGHFVKFQGNCLATHSSLPTNMPPGRPPSRNRRSHPQSAPSRASTTNSRLSSSANTTANRTTQASSPSRSSISLVSGDGDDHYHLTPFLNTTFSTHRLSPLYIGSKPLTHDRIQTLSHRLRDFLVGDVVRGVEVGLDSPADEGAMSRAGTLEAVSISWVKPDGLVGSRAGQKQQQDGPELDTSPTRGNLDDDQAGDTPGLGTRTGLRVPPGRTNGIQISLQYEYAECAALLLPPVDDGADPVQDMAAAVDQVPPAPGSLLDFAPSRPVENDPAFLHLPLLLMRMPSPLKAAIIGFLSRNFDCRVSPLNLGTRSLVRALEKWTGELGAETRVDSAKDVVLTLGFYAPTVMQCRRRRQPQQQQHQQQDMVQDEQTGLEEGDVSDASEAAFGVKSIDVIIPNADLVRLVTAGKACGAAKDAPSSQIRDRRKRTGAPCRDAYIEAKRRKLGGDKDEEGWTWRQRPGTSEDSGRLPQPFTDALAQYVLQHLALDMFHPAVRISKVACAGFVLSEGRVKIFGVSPSVDADRRIPDAEQKATWGVLNVLQEKARVEPPSERLRGKMGSLSN